MNEAKRAGIAMQALVFELGDEIFAIDAAQVREILDEVPITQVPNARPFVDGLINVRGRVVPLADLRVAFGMTRSASDQDSRIVVIEIELAGEPAIVAIYADRVHDVADIESASIEEAPKVGMRWRSEYVRGIGRRGDSFVIHPDLGRIFMVESGMDGSTENAERGSQ
ncbi:chemotaxis protein CheW [Litchfieldella qijiaojingensis]|uniref:Chemotaxis protein CheW n=1 Tax=Litchfieldella qijiaojingensis TaxID=980347 RepID=A0ABQ2Z9D4_9GAMM|nr:chemotaxis protein CheW [Halomonas qijiaojingensis]GGY08749.1 chemotaxis protein CheW [Halomonas qijiaojingensis]